MAIKEFQIGPISYIEDEYFDRDYTLSNIIRAYLDCDNEKTKGGRLNAVIQSNMTVSAGKFVDAKITAQDYTVESYFDGDYTTAQGSQFSLYLRPIFEVLFEAQLQSEVSTATIGNINVNASSEMSAAFTQTSVVNELSDIDLFAFSESAIQAQLDRLRDINLDATGYFSVANDVTRIKSLNADAASDFAFNSSIERSREFDIETQAAFSFDLIVEVIKDNQIAFASEFNQAVQEDLFKSYSSDIAAEFNSANIIDWLRGFESTSSSEFTQIVDFRVVRDAHLTAFDAVTITAVANVIWQSNYSTQPVESNITAVIGKQYFANADSVIVSGLKGAADRGVIMRTLAGTPTFTIDSTAGRASDTIVDNALYIIKTTSSSGNAGIYSVEVPDNQWTINECWDDSTYNGEDELSIRFKLKVSNNTAIQHFIMAGSISYGNYWSISYGRTNTRDLTFISYDASRTVNSTFIYSTPSLPTSIYNQWLDVEFKTQTYKTGYGTQRRAYFVVDGVTYGPLSATFASNGNSTDHLWGVNLSGNNRLSIKSNVFNLPLYIDELKINIKQNQTGDVYSDQFRKIYLPFTGNYYDWNTAVQQQAQASLTSNAVIQASLSGPQRADSTIVSTTALTAVIGKLNEIVLTAFDNANLSATATKIQNLESSISSDVNLTAEAYRIFDLDIASASEFNQSVDYTRIRYADSNLNSQFSNAVEATRIQQASASLESIASVNSIIGTLESIFLEAFTNNSLSTDAVKITDSVSSLNGVADLEASLNYIFSVNANLLDDISLSAEQDRIRSSEAVLNANGGVVAIGEEFVNVIVLAQSQFTTEQYYVEDSYVDDTYFEVKKIFAVKTADVQASLENSFTLSVSVRTDVFVAISVDSVADINADVVKTADNNVLQVSDFLVNADISKFVGNSSHINLEFAVLCNAVTAAEINAVLFNNAAVYALAEGLKPAEATLISEFTQNTNTFDSLNISFISDQSAEFSQTAEAVKNVDAVIQTDSIASALTVAAKDVVSDVLCEVRFDTVVDASKVTDITSVNDIAFTSNAEAVRTAAGVVDVNTAVSVYVDADVVKDAVIATDSIATQLTAVARIGAFFVNADVQATVTADVSVIRSAESLTASVSFVQTSLINTIKGFDIDLSSQFNGSAVVGVIKPFDVVIASAMTFVSAVREIRLDEIEYRIPGEGWEYKIVGENREYDIIGETRLRSITGETREKRIDGETRIYTVE